MAAYRHVAALGSSFASGPGIAPAAELRAGRSAANYPSLLAQRLGAELTDLTVAGATTETVLREPQRLVGATFPPQITGVPADADLITVTAGGNDLNYIGSVIHAASVGWLIRGPALSVVRRRLAPVPTPTRAEVAKVTGSLVEIVAAARRAAPSARVVLVDYLTVFGDYTRPHRDVPLGAAQIEAFRDIADQLCAAFADAASTTGADLCRASELSADHGIGSAEPWLVGLKPLLPLSFHPNRQGMQAVADALSRLVST